MWEGWLIIAERSWVFPPKTIESYLETPERPWVFPPQSIDPSGSIFRKATVISNTEQRTVSHAPAPSEPGHSALRLQQRQTRHSCSSAGCPARAQRCGRQTWGRMSESLPPQKRLETFLTGRSLQRGRSSQRVAQPLGSLCQRCALHDGTHCCQLLEDQSKTGELAAWVSADKGRPGLLNCCAKGAPCTIHIAVMHCQMTISKPGCEQHAVYTMTCCDSVGPKPSMPAHPNLLCGRIT